MILSHFVTSPIFSFYLSIPHNYYESPTSKEEKLFSAKSDSSTHSRGFFSISQSINLSDISSQTFPDKDVKDSYLDTQVVESDLEEKPFLTDMT